MWIRSMVALQLAMTGALLAQTGKAMKATGPFDVSMKPDTAATASYGRMVLSKQYHGALEATAAGEMLSGGDPKAGTAGYVAIETVAGSLEGKAGTFQLMQWGTMEGTQRELRVGIVPGSGTGALAGIKGTMRIEVAAGKHSYVLEYELPAS